MKGRYKRKVTKKRSRFYFLLSVIFVAVMAFWGVPALIEFVANGGGGNTLSAEKDTLPPQKPVFSSLPEFTNIEKITIAGYTEDGAKIKLFVNDNQVGDAVADDAGKFSFETSLKEGENDIYAKASDKAGNESSSEIHKVVFDNTLLEITLESPNDGDEFIGVSSETIDVKGSLNKIDANLSINGFFVNLDSEGKFSGRIKLKEGENTIKLSAKDKAGNSVEKEISVVYKR